MIDFSSASAELREWDAATSTLHVALRRERREGAHSFDLAVSFDAAPATLTISIDDAGTSLYHNGWAGYRPFVERGTSWVRLSEPGRYAGGVFSFDVAEPGQRVRVAWYPPYGLAAAAEFVASRFGARADATVDADADGFTVVRWGRPELPQVTMLARQHPGETIASFFLEGLVDGLLADTAAIERFLGRYCVVLVPIVNVDGVREQLHRYDSAGRDYNRSWSARRPPDGVARVRALVAAARSNALFLDLHGDEVSKISYASYVAGRVSPAGEALLGLIRTQQTDTYVWRPEPYWKRLAKNVIRRRRVVLPRGLRANKFAARAGRCLSITYELSAHCLGPEQARGEGSTLADSLLRTYAAEAALSSGGATP